MEDKDEEDIFLPANKADLIQRKSPEILTYCKNKLVTTDWVLKRFWPIHRMGYVRCAEWLMEQEREGLIQGVCIKDQPLSLWDKFKNLFLAPKKRKKPKHHPYTYKVLI